MSYNKCQECNPCSQSPCVENHECECPVFITTDCSTLTEDLECSGILKGQTETEVLKQLDAYICERFNSVENFFNLINVGDGAQVYKGISILGKKELRTLVDSNLINIVQGTNDITISVDETALNTFIEANQKTYSASNLGTGASVYKDTTVAGDNTQFNLRKINTSNSGTGASILKTQLENTNDISIISKSLLLESQGTGESIVRDLQENTDDIKARVKSLISNTLTITATDEEISIDTPASATIPALYVNNLYVPTYLEFLEGNTKGLGTIAKPFTDTINYTNSTTYTTTPNTAIQNAIDAYVGTGGAGTVISPTSPELNGQSIVIQDNYTNYTYQGTFNYQNISIVLEKGTLLYSTPTESWLFDSDKFSNTSTTILKINVEEDAILICNKNGFRNNGTTIDNSAFTQIKRVIMTGQFRQAEETIVSQTYTLIESNATNQADFKNDGAETFDIVDAYLSVGTSKLYRVGGDSMVKIRKTTLEAGGFPVVINPAFFIFEQNGGIITKQDTTLIFTGSGRGSAYKFTNSGTYVPQLTVIDSLLTGYGTTLFSNSNTDNITLNLLNVKTNNFSVVNLIETPHILPDKLEVGIINCIFNNAGVANNIDFTKSNSSSTTNTISSKIREDLVVFSSKADAVSVGGLGTGNIFLKRITVPAGAFVVGVEYQIASIGSTNFTTIGAASNTVGLYFTATGTPFTLVGTGTGTAYLDSREIIM